MAIKNLGRVKGEDGKSAYEIWLAQGNNGTEEDFLNSLKANIENFPIVNLEGTEDNPIVIRNLETGVYVYKGYAIPFEGSEDLLLNDYPVLMSVFVNEEEKTTECQIFIADANAIMKVVAYDNDVSIKSIDLDDLATAEYVNEKISEAQLGGEVDLSDYAKKEELNEKVDKVEGKGLSTNDYTTEEKEKLANLENYDDTNIQEEINSLNNTKQDTLVSGETIKTINGLNILGEGNIEIEGGELVSSPLTGKKLSLIGDSITTYSGYLPSGNATRYPRGAITNVEQTWWKQLLNETGMILGQNCAWDGSTCSGLSTSITKAYAGCSDKRISQLGLNGNPDIIICFIGINDWGATYNKNKTHYGGTFVDGAFVPVGDYTGETALPSGELKTFSEAYGCMIGKIQQNYPNAKLYCCTLLQTNGKETYNYDADGVFPSVNRDGVSIAEYNNCIRTLAKNMGAEVIEFAECGIHWGNIDTYMEDGLHPNVEGMKLLKEKAKNKLKLDFNVEMVKAYVSEGGSNYDDTELRGLIADLNENKQDTLISGENIKTINGNSILGEGNLELATETRYTITVDSENVILSNVKNDILAGLDYETNINCENGYKLGSVTVTIDGNDVTSDVYTKNSNTNATIKIEGVDGNISIEIETVAVQTYSIANNLTNVKNSNNSINVVENDLYQATLTPDSIYILKDENVTVTMGGVDITEDVYSNGQINIVNVTGNVVITASGTPKPSYAVVNNLTNVTNSNVVNSVVEGFSYEATITPDKYYSLDEEQISITMGDVDITSEVYVDGVINIPNVTGIIVITITAKANEITWYTNKDQSKHTGSVVASSKGWAVSDDTMALINKRPVNRVSFVSTASSGTMEICLAQKPATTVSETPMRNIEYIEWDSINKVGNIVTIEIPTVTPKQGEYFTVFANSTPDSDAFCYYDAGNGNGDFYSYVNKPNNAWQSPTKYQLLFNFGYCEE